MDLRRVRDRDRDRGWVLCALTLQSCSNIVQRKEDVALAGRETRPSGHCGDIYNDSAHLFALHIVSMAAPATRYHTLHWSSDGCAE